MRPQNLLVCFQRDGVWGPSFMHIQREHEGDELPIQGKQLSRLLRPPVPQARFQGTEKGVVENKVELAWWREGEKVSVLKLHELSMWDLLCEQLGSLERSFGDVEAGDASGGAGHGHHVVAGATARHQNL